MEEERRLKKKYEDMPDGELLERLAEGKEQYTEVAYGLLLGEVKRRGIEGQINKPREVPIDIEVSNFKEVKEGYKFYCISIAVLSVSLFVLLAIPNFNAAYQYAHQIVDYKSSSLLSILDIVHRVDGMIFWIAGIGNLFAVHKMATHLKIHNMTKLQPWVWVVSSCIPIISFVIMVRIFLQSRKLLKKLNAKE